MPIATEEIMTYEEMKDFVRTHRCGCGSFPLQIAWGGGIGYGQQWVLRCGDLEHDTMTKHRPSLADRLRFEELRHLHGGPKPTLYDRLPEELKPASPAPVTEEDRAQAKRDIAELWD